MDLNFDNIPDHLKAEIVELLVARENWKKYHRLEDFKPYPFQKRFYEASKNYKRRFLCAANR